MEDIKKRDLSSHILRGGIKYKIDKSPDRIALRLKRGSTQEQIIESYHASFQKSFYRQKIEEFSVDVAQRDKVMDRIRQGGEAEFASHVYYLDSDPEQKVFLTDEITIQFEESATNPAIEKVVLQHGLTLVKKIANLKNTYVFRLTTQSKENPIKLCNRLQAHSDVEVCEPNILVSTRQNYIPEDNLFQYQWHLDHQGGPFLSDDAHVDATRAWDIERGKRSVVIAVIDDSIDINHVDFQGQGKVVSPVDFVGRDFQPLPERTNDNHGTACAGVALAEENGSGVVGVAPGCALMPIRMSGIDDNSVEEYFSWAMTKGASVISCSWGPASRNYPLSIRQKHAIDQAATLGRNGLGCIIVFAAGNSNRPVNDIIFEDGWPDDRLQGETHWYDGFVCHEKVITVSACTSQAKKSAYSNWGKEITVCAPSSNARPDTYPQVLDALPGWGVVTTDRVGPSGYASADYTGAFGGTSSACPLVAGIAALIISANPLLHADEVSDILKSTAEKINDDNVDPQLKLNHSEYNESGHSLWFGYGKVNAFSALEEAVRRKDSSIREIIKTHSEQTEIPDNDESGITSELLISDSGTLSYCELELDISHSYIGDLVIELVSPSGTIVTIHNRKGGRTQNIRNSFTLQNTPELFHYQGENIEGNWLLRIKDVANDDVGNLNAWGLKFGVLKALIFEERNTQNQAIPDNDVNGITSEIPNFNQGIVKDLEVSVDITHSYIGDLTVSLISPEDDAAFLHQQSGWEKDNIIKTYRMNDTYELKKLIGKKAKGDWRLKVADLAGDDIGKLNQWSLKLLIERE